MINMVKDKCDVGLVVNERSGSQSEKQNESSRSRNDRRAEGADVRLSNEPEPMNEVQSTTSCNVFANDRQHVEQPKFIDDGGVNHDVVQCLNKRPLLASVIENKTTESLHQTLESENDCLKKTIAKLQKDFSKLEAQNDSSSCSTAEGQIFELEKESGENIFEMAICELQTKIDELEKILTKQKKDVDDVKLELSNIIAKFEGYFKKLENSKVVLE
ncbi:hypothetical protein Tco_1226214 [Tanacetum coccineum]